MAVDGAGANQTAEVEALQLVFGQTGVGDGVEGCQRAVERAVGHRVAALLGDAGGFFLGFHSL